MTYNITEYTLNKANELNVSVKPSINKKKKLDIFKDNKKIASVGAIGYLDYPTYIEQEGIYKANQRRRLYKLRHEKYRKIKGSNSWWADVLLW